MLKTTDIAVSKPAECPFRHYMYFEESDTDAFDCHDLNNSRRDKLIPCNNREAFPEGCPLSKSNINVWRDK